MPNKYDPASILSVVSKLFNNRFPFHLKKCHFSDIQCGLRSSCSTRAFNGSGATRSLPFVYLRLLTGFGVQVLLTNSRRYEESFI